MTDTMTATFVVDKETKNTKRFAEEPSNLQPPIMNTAYVQRWVLAQMGDPDKIRVTIEAVE